MISRYSVFSIIAAALMLLSVHVAHAGTPMSDRVAVEAKVRAEVSKDLALPYKLDRTAPRSAPTQSPVDWL